jgi:hypothetical protein
MHHANISYLWNYDLNGPVRHGGFLCRQIHYEGKWRLGPGGPKKVKTAITISYLHGLSHQWPDCVGSIALWEQITAFFSRAEKPSEDIQ